MTKKIKLKKYMANIYLKAKFYRCKISKKSANHLLVCIMRDGYHKKHPGWADRLKTIVGLFYIARQNGYQFKLIFTTPFDLKKYLKPNKIEWVCEPEEFSNSLFQTRLLEYAPYKEIPQLNQKVKQYHCYIYSGQDTLEINGVPDYQKEWHDIYNDLFTPTEYTLKILEKGGVPTEKYAAIHFRFVNSLGNFENTIGYNELSESEKMFLIKKCLVCIEEIQKKIEMPLVIFSDSSRFLSEVKKAGYKCLNGDENIGHITFDKVHGSDAYDKTFMDFFAMAYAETVFSVRGRSLYSSQFPYYASLAGNMKFEVINLDIE